MSDEANRCGGCKWWDCTDAPDLREDGQRIFDEDNNWETTPAPGRWGWCKKVAEFGPGKSDKFYVIDGSEYRADLNCREDFGCVEWEADGR